MMGLCMNLQSLFLWENFMVRSRLSDSELLKEIHKAAVQYQSLLGHTFLIVGKNRKSEYFWFQCRFEKKNFMHLLGISSGSLRADKFYERALEGNHCGQANLSVQDCTPSRNHNRTTVNEKSSCCADLFRLEDAAYMKVGSKDKISQYVDFSYAYGRDEIIGFERYKGSDECFPITVIPRNIEEFSTRWYKVIFVFRKPAGADRYERIPFAEMKKGLCNELIGGFPTDLRNLIREE